MALTDTAAKNAKPRPKPYKLFDAGGLFLLVNPNGRKGWRFKYRIDGREKLISLGVYPDVPLKLAREWRDEARKQVASGIDPSAKRQAETSAAADTFEAVAREWFDKQKSTWAESHSSKIIGRLERELFPWIGKRPVASLEPGDILACVRRPEQRGTVETARRALQNCSQVMRYAVATGRATSDPTRDLRGALAPVTTKGFASITEPGRLGDLMRAVDTYSGSFIVGCAMRLLPLLFTRPGELRQAEWSEIDLDTGLWTIPGARMKGRTDFMVPLSTQAIAILRELEPLTGDGRFVFPGRDPIQPISDNTIGKGYRKIKFASDEMTPHGLRKTASTILNEQGFNPDWIEAQLAHKTIGVRGIYNKAKYLADRTRMMQAWSDYLYGLKASDNIVSIRRRAG
jgi:integrase